MIYNIDYWRYGNKISLLSISITQTPTKTVYNVGESFDPSGMVITATYSDNTTKEISNYSIINGSNFKSGWQDVTISYSENNKTTTVSQSIFGKITGPTLAKQGTWYKSSLDKKQITSFNIATSKPSKYTETWDASEDQDGSVIAYLNVGAGQTVTETLSDYSAMWSEGYKGYMSDSAPTLNSGNYVFASSTSTTVYSWAGWSGAASSYFMLEDVANVYYYYDGSKYNKITYSQPSSLTLMESSGDNIYLNFDSYKVFDGFSSVSTLSGLNLLKTVNVTNMSYMFYECSSLTSLDVSNFDTSNVNNMSSMFCGCKALTSLDLNSFNTSNAVSMIAMFANCSNLASLKLNNFDTSNVNSMSSMFQSCKSLTNLDISHFNTSNITNMSGMFQNTILGAFNISNFNTSKVTNMSYMFAYCSGTSINLNHFNTSKVTNMSNMFSSCKELTNISIESIDMSNVTNVSMMFYECDSLTDIDLSILDLGAVTNSSYMFSYCDKMQSLIIPSCLSTIGTSFAASCPALTTITFLHDTNDSISITSNAFKVSSTISTTLNAYNDIILNYDWLSDNRSIVGGPPMLASKDSWYKASIPQSNIVTMSLSKETPSIYDESWDASATQDGSIMAYLTKEEGTTQVSDTTSTDIWNLGTGTISKTAPTLVDGKWVLQNPITGISPYSWAPFMTSSDYSYTKYPYFIPDKDQTTYCWYTGSKLEKVSYCCNATLIVAPILADFMYANINSASAFKEFTALTSLNGLDLLDTSKTTDVGSMFYNCKTLTSLDLSNFDTSRVTNMLNMFGYCESLNTLDLSNFNTSNVTNMQSMFSNCKSLTRLNISSFNTSKVTTMYGMFSSCEALTSLDLSNFNTSNVTTMQSMFSLCKALTSLDLNSFNTSKVTNMQCMFDFCQVLTSLNISTFDTSQVTDMQQMFYYCQSLTSINVSSFNILKVTNMCYMFANCNALTELDVSSFDTSSVTNLAYFISGSYSLTKLILSTNFMQSNNVPSNLAFMNNPISITIYNANSVVKAYDWSKDNVTATFV